MSRTNRTCNRKGRFRSKWHRHLPAVFAGLLLPVLVWWSGCVSERFAEPSNRKSATATMTVTGYCNCGECCNWRRSWMGLGPPVIEKGPNAGRPKQVGVTASGTRAAHGTLAADTAVLPFGTIVYVPGYGYGRVEDRGGAITGMSLDLWFPSHEEAMNWGRRRMNVRVWKP